MIPMPWMAISVVCAPRRAGHPARAETNSPAIIGNAIGSGSTNGTTTGYTPPLSGVTGTIVSLTSTPPFIPTDNTIDTLLTVQETEEPGTPTGVTNQPGPLEDLTDSSGSGESDTDKSDQVADAVGDSLDGSSKKSTSESYFGGMLKKLQPQTPTSTPRGIPADADFSSWGNEAFWQWR